MKNFISFLFTIFLVISCNDPSLDIAREEAAIYSISIDELAVSFPLPPMPPKDSLEREIQNTNWDSIKTAKTTLVVDTIMFKTDKRTSLTKEFQEFEKLSKDIHILPSKAV